MKLLMIAWGYLPYSFSEGLCNAKLNYALQESGIDITTVSRVDTGNTYDRKWNAPWDKLKDNTILIDYPLGNRLTRCCDVIYSSFVMNGCRERGVRWARRAYQTALGLVRSGEFDAVLTRSPNDIAHLIGYKLKQKTGIRWIANWNDPASPIWPAEYNHNFRPRIQEKKMKFTWKLLSEADVNTFPCDNLRQHFISAFPKLIDCNTSVIPHIALVSSIWPKTEVVKKSNEKVRLIHSGNLSKERNPENTFKALRKLVNNGYSQFEFHIMGYVNEFTQSLIQKYELTEYVKGIGSFGYLESVAKLQEYDILVLLEAKLDNGIFFASKITDYAQTRLPILAISPQKGFAKDLINKYKCGIAVDNLSVDSIYNGIKTLITDKESRSCYDSKNLIDFVSPSSVVKLYREII